MREAVVCLFLKRPLLDPTILNNFFPVVNLPFWGKVMETMVGLQLQRPQEELDYVDLLQ